MTRSTLRRTLRRLYIFIAVVLSISLFSKLAEHVPILVGSGIEKILKDFYEFFKDMALLIATGGVAYISNVFQKRHAFLDNLKTEWREIIDAKSTLLIYMHKPQPTHEEYVAAFTQLSEAIDNMRIVYRNVGETPELIGLYPFATLRDMMRVMQTLDPRKGPTTDEQRKLARDTMLQSFYALRDKFLEELDLEMPDNPILMPGARRLRISGAEAWARNRQLGEIALQKRVRPQLDENDHLLRSQFDADDARYDAAVGEKVMKGKRP
jgi:hypothetical protein